LNVEAAENDIARQMLFKPEEIASSINEARWRWKPHHRCVEAAILVPLFNRQEQTHVLIIEKARDQSHHSGQMAFPGGKRERSDASPTSAALREAHEEIDLPPDHVRVLGSMGYFRTMTSRFDAAVTVGWLPEVGPWRHNREVVNTFQIPLAALLMEFDPALKACTRTGLLNLHYHVQPRDTSRTICIWGLTARILHHFFIAMNLAPEAE
jgi:8-oxo-dGTP pyrophosphatase MutT (NUDIX family)